MQAHRRRPSSSALFLVAAAAALPHVHAQETSVDGGSVKLSTILIGVGVGAVVGFAIVYCVVRFDARRSQWKANVHRTADGTCPTASAESARLASSSGKPAPPPLSYVALASPVHDVITLGTTKMPETATDTAVDNTLRSSNPTMDMEWADDMDVPIMEEWAADEESSVVSDDDKGFVLPAATDGRLSMVIIDPSDSSRDGFYL
ncbi:Aste57867_23247 [Aphanomyces stellatus]|uniref:Aste57867_23247 protein n=1 Tax=Aphanomyces stellatus TaxID=120398 RepID=A0A485LM80_9STRA|nr:hypothetical protein As57867_023176 [Aphanomyces stellatus]VFT99892.1 Aste57867_23247 [Aphanomyces stellatus]